MADVQVNLEAIRLALTEPSLTGFNHAGHLRRDQSAKVGKIAPPDYIARISFAMAGKFDPTPG